MVSLPQILWYCCRSVFPLHWNEYRYTYDFPILHKWHSVAEESFLLQRTPFGHIYVKHRRVVYESDKEIKRHRQQKTYINHATTVFKKNNNNKHSTKYGLDGSATYKDTWITKRRFSDSAWQISMSKWLCSSYLGRVMDQMQYYNSLTHCSRETSKRVIGKQCRPRSDAAERGVWSGSSLFANSLAIFLLEYLNLVAWPTLTWNWTLPIYSVGEFI